MDQWLTFNLYGMDSKYTDVAEILFESVMKPWVRLQKKAQINNNNNNSNNNNDNNNIINNNLKI